MTESESEVSDSEFDCMNISPVEFPGQSVRLPETSPEESLEDLTNFTISTSTVDITVMTKVAEKRNILTYRIVTRNGENFFGALSRRQVYEIWNTFDLDSTLIRGLSLMQAPKRPFMFDFFLHEPVDILAVPRVFKHQIDGATYEGEFVRDDAEIPLLGEEVQVFVKRTRFRITPIQVKPWLSTFGLITNEPDFLPDPEIPNLITDDIKCSMVLTRHIYGLLPAFGRKVRVSYKGQPIQCGKCFSLGHIRSECTNERVDWLKYTRIVLNETNVPSSMLGRWYDLMIENKF